jgi:hypothetical protein
MTATELNPELRKLIDARLDAVDRVLVSAELAWSERRNIIDEVETQVFELLARRTSTPAAADVLAVLESLDPPESYRPETSSAGAGVSPVTTTTSGANWMEQLRTEVARWGVAAAWCGGLLIANGVVVAIIASSEGVLPWLFTLAGLAWLNVVVIRWWRTSPGVREGHVLHDIRQTLAAWLTPANGASAT